MRDTDAPRSMADAEHMAYARLLFWCGWAGFAALVLAFVVYLSGMLLPLIAVDGLPHAWSMPAHQLVAQKGHPSGWTWIGLLHHGDILNLLGIAMLAGCSALPLAVVALLYVRRGERLYGLLAVAQAAVLLLAASGLIAVGH